MIRCPLAGGPNASFTTRLLGTLIPGLALLGCSGGEEAPERDRIVVAVPVAPLAGLVDALVPDSAVTTVVLVPPGANPATHEPSVRELRHAASADLYLELGHPSFVFERAWLAGLLDDSAAERIALFADCPVVEEDYHVWLSTQCLADAAKRLATALTRLMPNRREELRVNLRAFLARAAETDSATAGRLAPLRGRAFMVLHPAWGYLARPWGLTQLSLLSHGSGDPGPARLAALIRRGRDEGIRLVIVQPQFNPAPARLVADELGAEIVSVDPLRRDPLRAIDKATSALASALANGGHDP